MSSRDKDYNFKSSAGAAENDHKENDYDEEYQEDAFNEDKNEEKQD